MQENNNHKLTGPIVTRYLSVFFVSVPVLWVLGLEQQLLAFVVFGLFFVLSALNPGVVLVGNRGWLYLYGFMFVYLLSITSIDENYRYITYLRDCTVYISYILLFILVVSITKSMRAIKQVLFALVIFLLVINIISATYLVLGEWSFETLISKWLPVSIRDTTTGQNMAVKSVGRELRFFGLTDIRLKGLFSSGIHYASVILMLLPVFIWLRSSLSGYRRHVVDSAIITSIVSLFFTQSRTAMLIVMFMPFLYYFLLYWARSETLDKKLAFISFFGVLVSMVCFLIIVNSSELLGLFKDIFVDARKGSAESRFLIYQLTLEGVYERPLLGWGTQRDVAFLDYPVGSHNWYLSVAYKHGLVGLVFLMLFVSYLLSRSFKSMTVYHGGGYVKLSVALLLGLGGYLTVAATLEPVVDAIAFNIFAIYCGLLIAYCKHVTRHFYVGVDK